MKNKTPARPSRHIIPIATAACLLALAACDNPADDTPDAEVSDPVPTESDAESREPTADPADHADSGQDAAAADPVKYVLAPDSTITFIGSKVTGSHEGGFERFQGHFTVAGDALHESGHEFVIDMTSTWADHPKLQEHLLSEDFFHVEEFPEARFEVTSIDGGADGSYRVAGNLTLHGVTKNIAFPARVTKLDDEVRIASEFDINRFDFDIRFPGKPDDLIRKEVVIRLDLVARPEA